MSRRVVVTGLGVVSPLGCELNTFLEIIQDSLSIRRHIDLFHWLQDEVQVFLPHDILIAAWGDFENGEIHLDVVSYMPGLRTTEVDRQDLLPMLSRLFGKWVGSDRSPFVLTAAEGTFQLPEHPGSCRSPACPSPLHQPCTCCVPRQWRTS